MRGAVGPGASLRADAHQGYSVKEAIQLCRGAESLGVGLELLEQPVAAWDFDGMAEVRRAVDTMIESDEGAYTAHDVMNLARRGAADVINLKIGKGGGLLHAKKIAAVAEAENGYALPLAEDGCLPVPTSPGLGITLDDETVARYTVG